MSILPRAGNDSDSILLQQVQKMWEVDFNDAKSLQREEMSVQDKQALSIMEETICKTPDGHYQLAMPWKSNVSHLRNNCSMVENRMKSLAKRFQCDPELQVKYTAVVEDNINKGLQAKFLMMKSKALVLCFTYHTIQCLIPVSRVS